MLNIVSSITRSTFLVVSLAFLAACSPSKDHPSDDVVKNTIDAWLADVSGGLSEITDLDTSYQFGDNGYVEVLATGNFGLIDSKVEEAEAYVADTTANPLAFGDPFATAEKSVLIEKAIQNARYNEGKSATFKIGYTPIVNETLPWKIVAFDIVKE